MSAYSLSYTNQSKIILYHGYFNYLIDYLTAVLYIFQILLIAAGRIILRIYFKYFAPFLIWLKVPVKTHV